jgi:hypothetical protein
MSYEDDFEGNEGFFDNKPNDFYYMINLPNGFEKLKVDKSMIVRAVIVPYVTTASPYTKPGKLWFSRDYYRHRGLGPEQKGSYFDCVKTFGDDKCPIGDAMHEAGVSKKSQRMALFNLFVLQIDKEKVEKLMLLDFSFANFAEVLGTTSKEMFEMDGDSHLQHPYHPTKGAIISWKFTEETFKGAKFYKASTFQFKPHNGLDGKIEELIPKALDLDAALNKLSYEEAKKRFISGMPPIAKKGEGESTTETKTSKAESAKADKAVEEAKALATDESAFDSGWE